MQNRRQFISTVAAAGAAIPFVSGMESIIPSPAESKYPVRLFSKPLDTYDFAFMCECIVKSGIGGIDLVVRPGGRVEPAVVEKELPERIAEAKKFNLVTDMMVSGITTASDPFTERVLKTASAAGIKYYRLGWFDYDQTANIWDSLQKSRIVIKEIAELNKKYKIHGGYQNHAGPRVGGPVWDLHELLKDIPAEYLGSQYDVRHAMVEGANTWILGMKLIAPHIRTLAIKDFTWKTVNGKAQAVTVPMGEGMINWDTFFKTVKELNITGPLTLHIEYPLLEAGEDKLPLTQQQEIIVRKIKKDMTFLNTYLDKYQLT
ncbi:MAG: sugar phosphate isomerase/epimerase [Bacteroidales bacterium]|nr:sugar phosphate isomerase/epimerase [Bacteroidales bacterium]